MFWTRKRLPTPSETLLQPAPMLAALPVAHNLLSTCSVSQRLPLCHNSKVMGAFLADVNGNARLSVSNCTSSGALAPDEKEVSYKPEEGFTGTAGRNCHASSTSASHSCAFDSAGPPLEQLHAGGTTFSINAPSNPAWLRHPFEKVYNC